VNWQTILSAKTSGSGEYLSGGPFSPIPSSIWGVSLIPSPAIASGTGLVGDFRLGAQVFVRSGVVVLMSDSATARTSSRTVSRCLARGASRSPSGSPRCSARSRSRRRAMSMQFPSADATVTDEQGQERLIFAGSPVPEHLAEAYEEGGGQYSEQEAPMAKLAATDAEIEDEQGVPRLIFAGTTVPEVWEERYEDAGGSFATDASALDTKPGKDKAQRTPDTVKSGDDDDVDETSSPTCTSQPAPPARLICHGT
jgi:hypothetical protein